ncbi:hypothetical protein PPERSA_04302 [Pseudocohnilembus persalinus]|uniref:Uncharacterized protein n=1 Tax=Pseudocohnilembus persalinus TaxID=266149 RepID=A0A0V0QNF7_PSEPJ|nr:hypothetical protein PPERSA_04302 [Pseudocohnilembus persalinus]|eukprot:KRX03794.1 hypothetical protein PPERSA_04302 [Pseudocohnilembus persalinus]
MKIHSNNPSKLKLQILHQLLESKSNQKSKFDQISKWVPKSTQILDKENLLTKKLIKEKLKSLSNEKLKQQTILSNTLPNQQQNFQTPVSDSKYKKQQSFYNKQSSAYNNYLNETYDINNNDSPIQFQKNSKSFNNLQQQQLFSENEKLNQINSSFEMEDYKLFYNEDRNKYIQFMKKLKRAHSSINFQNDNLNNINASQSSQNFNQNQHSGTFKENLINKQILQQQFINQNQGSQQQGHDLMSKTQSLYEHLLDNSKMRANFLQLSTGNIRLTSSKKKLSQLYSRSKTYVKFRQINTLFIRKNKR